MEAKNSPHRLPIAIRFPRRPRMVWQEQTLSRSLEIETLLNWFERMSNYENKDILAEAVRVHLSVAREGASVRGQFSSIAASARALANLDAARLNLLRLAPPDYIIGNMPNLLTEARSQLRPADVRLQQLERLAGELEDNERKFTDLERSAVIAAISGAAEEGRRIQTRLRTFTQMVLTTTIMLTICATGVALLGFTRPTVLPLCFLPEPATAVVCPTGVFELRSLPGGSTTPSSPSPSEVDDATKAAASRNDILLVELLGILGATISLTIALRRIRGSPDPYTVAWALAVLKLPSGALTAFLGLTLIRAQFVPGLSALDSSAQIMAWAVVLGYAQDLFTRAIDARAASVLEQADSVKTRTVGLETRANANPAVPNE